jgi:hypothetical protein
VLEAALSIWGCLDNGIGWRSSPLEVDVAVGASGSNILSPLCFTCIRKGSLLVVPSGIYVVKIYRSATNIHIHKLARYAYLKGKKRYEWIGIYYQVVRSNNWDDVIQLLTTNVVHIKREREGNKGLHTHLFATQRQVPKHGARSGLLCSVCIVIGA